jgi:hypothetical protein
LEQAEPARMELAQHRQVVPPLQRFGPRRGDQKIRRLVPGAHPARAGCVEELGGERAKLRARALHSAGLVGADVEQAGEASTEVREQQREARR